MFVVHSKDSPNVWFLPPLLKQAEALWFPPHPSVVVWHKLNPSAMVSLGISKAFSSRVKIDKSSVKFVFLSVTKQVLLSKATFFVWNIENYLDKIFDKFKFVFMVQSELSGMVVWRVFYCKPKFGLFYRVEMWCSG